MAAPRIDLWLSAAADASDDLPYGANTTRSERDTPSSVSSISPDDSAYLARLRTNDETALDELMQRYTTDVLRTAYHYVRSDDAAYDVAQEVFLSLWHRRHVLDDRAPLLHYLRRAARYRAIDLLKQASAQSRLIERATGEAMSTARYAENTGLAAARAAEVDMAIRKIVSTLTPRVREVLLLYYERGLEPGEIATLLQIAPRTVYSQLRTALRALAAALDVYENDG